jgi:preprotein translocase subunit SecF
MFVIAHRKFFFAVSSLLIVLSLAAVLFLGLHFSIDFTSGSLTEVSYPQDRSEKALVEDQLKTLPIGSFSLREAGEDGYILRTKSLSEEERQAVFGILSLGGTQEVRQERFTTIGPLVGTELRNKALVAVILAVIVITLFIAFSFRKVSEPVSSWKYGLIAIVALLHDIIVPIGLFAVLGYLFAAEIDTLFIMALLAILGYSINDTIVIFDRVRENLKTNQELRRHEAFDITVGKSLNQTYARSINTSLTTVLTLLALFFIGAPITQNFALVLLAGIIAGTYSSIFLAAPLLVAIERLRGKKTNA